MAHSVEEYMGLEEGERLHEVDAIYVVAENARPARLLNLTHLVAREAMRLVTIVVEVPAGKGERWI